MPDTLHLHTFPNGLVLLAESMPHLASAAMSLVVPAGSVHDPPERRGLSSFTCEMALRGAGPYDNRAFLEKLNNLGAERNESVGDAYTIYGAATVAGNLPAVIDVFGELVQRPHLPEEEVEASRLALLQELWSIEDDPAQKTMMELKRVHYPNPWGYSSYGAIDSIQAVTRDEVRDHFDRHYRPNGCVLSVAGRFDWDALRETVGRALGDWPAKPDFAVTDTPSSERYVHFDHDSAQAQIGIAYPAVPYRHEDYFLAWAAVGALSGGCSARLFTEVRERRGLCYTVNASYHTLRHLAGVFCYAGTTAPRAQETFDVTLAELRRVRDGIDQEELQRLKAQVRSGLVMQQESSAARSAAMARDWHCLGRVRPLSEVEARVDALSVERINDYLRSSGPAEFSVVTMGPEHLEVSGAFS